MSNTYKQNPPRRNQNYGGNKTNPFLEGLAGVASGLMGQGIGALAARINPNWGGALGALANTLYAVTVSIVGVKSGNGYGRAASGGAIASSFLSLLRWGAAQTEIDSVRDIASIDRGLGAAASAANQLPAANTATKQLSAGQKKTPAKSTAPASSATKTLKASAMVTAFDELHFMRLDTQKDIPFADIQVFDDNNQIGVKQGSEVLILVNKADKPWTVATDDEGHVYVQTAGHDGSVGFAKAEQKNQDFTLRDEADPATADDLEEVTKSKKVLAAIAVVENGSVSFIQQANNQPISGDELTYLEKERFVVLQDGTVLVDRDNKPWTVDAEGGPVLKDHSAYTIQFKTDADKQAGVNKAFWWTGYEKSDDVSGLYNADLSGEYYAEPSGDMAGEYYAEDLGGEYYADELAGEYYAESYE